MTHARPQPCSRACVVGAASFGLLIAVCCLTAEASDSARQLLEQAARLVPDRLSKLSMVSAGTPPGLTAFDFQVHSLSFAHSISRTRCLSSALFVSFSFTSSPFAITHTRAFYCSSPLCLSFLFLSLSLASSQSLSRSLSLFFSFFFFLSKSLQVSLISIRVYVFLCVYLAMSLTFCLSVFPVPLLAFSFSFCLFLPFSCHLLSPPFSFSRTSVCALSLSFPLFHAFSLSRSLSLSPFLYFFPFLSLNFASLSLLLLLAHCLFVLSLSRAQFCAQFLFQSYALFSLFSLSLVGAFLLSIS